MTDSNTLTSTAETSFDSKKPRLGFWRSLGIIAATLLVTGLPQLHYGRMKRGVIVGAIGLALGVASGTIALKGPGILYILLTLLVAFLGFALIDAFRSARAWNVSVERTRPPKWAYAAFLVVVLGIAFLAPSRPAAYNIPSGSMLPMFFVGDRIIVDSGAYDEDTKPSRGDIVVFSYPRDPSIDYIKRIVGLPGDRIEIRDKVVYVNGEKSEQSPIPTERSEAWKAKFDGALENADLAFETEKLGAIRHPIILDRKNDMTATFGPFNVEPGKYFVMGDNRDFSNDSRFWGYVPEENLKGRYLYIYWPLSRMGANVEER